MKEGSSSSHSNLLELNHQNRTRDIETRGGKAKEDDDDNNNNNLHHLVLCEPSSALLDVKKLSGYGYQLNVERLEIPNYHYYYYYDSLSLNWHSI